MTKKKTKTEADLEARVLAVLCKTLPWLSASKFSFQTSFTFRIGHSEISVDGKKVSSAHGRADIIIQLGSEYLAVFELKRPGWPLQKDDIDQGLSYAKFLTPQPPLVIVSNGADTRLFLSSNGEEWVGASPDESSLAARIKSAMQVAASDNRNAIRTLIGPKTNLWKQAISGTSEERFKEISGDMSDLAAPIVTNFSIDRKVTNQIYKFLEDGRRVCLLAGAPLSGRTNVLRQIFKKSIESDFSCLYIDLNNSGASILRSIGDVLSAHLDWACNEEEVRQWLTDISIASNGPKLVLLLDGLQPQEQNILREIEDLCSPRFGHQLRIVSSIDDADVHRLTHGLNGRTLTRMGRATSVSHIGSLDRDEFNAMAVDLFKKGLLLMRGAEQSGDWREPWIFRTLLANLKSEQIDPKSEDELPEGTMLAADLPPFFGCIALDFALKNFSHLPKVRAAYGGMAKAILGKLEGDQQPQRRASNWLQLLPDEVEIIKAVSEAQINEMIKQGYWRREYRGAGLTVIAPRMPELLAAELSHQIGVQLCTRIKSSPAKGAQWLAEICTQLPLGPVVGAAAIRYAARLDNAVLSEILNQFINLPPSRVSVPPGTALGSYWPGVGRIEIAVRSITELELQVEGKMASILKVTEGEFPTMINQAMPWLILSYIASSRMEQVSNSNEPRVDYLLFLQIGSCPIILRTQNDDPIFTGVHSHTIEGQGEAVCSLSGIVEPITEAMRIAILRDGVENSVWVNPAIEIGNFSLLMRLAAAFRTIKDYPNEEFQTWATSSAQKISEKIRLLLPSSHKH